MGRLASATPCQKEWQPWLQSERHEDASRMLTSLGGCSTETLAHPHNYPTLSHPGPFCKNQDQKKKKVGEPSTPGLALAPADSPAYVSIILGTSEHWRLKLQQLEGPRVTSEVSVSLRPAWSSQALRGLWNFPPVHAFLSASSDTVFHEKFFLQP